MPPPIPPFSSPKNSDYFTGSGGGKRIRKDTISIMRIRSVQTDSNEELLGSLKMSNMIPVSAGELSLYKINDEKDFRYKRLVMKEYAYIKANERKIPKNARILYNQKTNPDGSFRNQKVPGYIENTVDFAYAETKCKEFCP